METGAGLTPGSPFPAGTTTGTYRIPLALVDQNMVRELNAGVFPHPNTTCTGPGGACKQFVISINQPENIREDVVRIDHSINSKFQLMGHYLHDAMVKTFFPPLWAGGQPTDGTIMANPSYTAAIKLTQTYSSSLLNETAFFYSGNKINLTPIPGAGVNHATDRMELDQQRRFVRDSYHQPVPDQRSGGLNHAFAPKAALMPAIALSGTPRVQPTLPRTIHGRTAMKDSNIATISPGPRAVTSSNSEQPAARLQEPGTAGRIPWAEPTSARTTFPSDALSNSILGLARQLQPARVPVWQALGQQQLQRLRD